jgi:carboxylesterase type B
MTARLASCLCAAALATSAATDPGPVLDYPIVNTTLGKLRGVTRSFEGSVLHTFRGIRYTDPKVNKTRFLKSTVYNTTWDGVRNATGYGAVCIQNPAAVSE